MQNLFSVSDFIALANQTFEYAYPSVQIEGEVANFKVNQGKFVFFDLKDAGASVGCFMTVWQLRMPIEDGMKVVITAAPKLTAWGKFSLTVQSIQPKGEGTIKKSFELLKAKLEKEGLFAQDRKRPLPAQPRHVAVISSTQAAGYGDFMKIADDRWGGVRFSVAHVQVQGAPAADQIIAAIKHFATQEDVPEVLVIIRGGGSADDLAVFNDELLVREIASSRIPTLVGVGHEIDVTLADLAADVRAATPSNAAQILLPDKRELSRTVRYQMQSLFPRMERVIDGQRAEIRMRLTHALASIEMRQQEYQQTLDHNKRLLNELNPRKVLERGYALLRGTPAINEIVTIETSTVEITAEVRNVRQK